MIALIEVKVTPQRGMGFDKIAERIYQYSEVDCRIPDVRWLMILLLFIEGKTMRAGGTVCIREAGSDGVRFEYRNPFCAEKI